MNFSKIKSIKSVGIRDSVDITVDSKEHLFYANGICTSNSHAVAYTMFSAYELFFKTHYPLEFYCVVINQVDRSKEKKGVDVLNQRVRHAAMSAIKIYPIDINKSKEQWVIENGGLRAGLAIKGLGKEASTIVENQPYSSIVDFLEKTKMGKGRMESLIFSGAFDSFDTRENIYNWYHNFWLNGGNKKKKDFFQENLFGEEFEEISDCIDDGRHFTNKELLELEYEMNGYLIPENIIVKYKDWIGKEVEGLKVKDISTVKMEGTKFATILGKVDGIRLSKSKRGKDLAYISLCDGSNFITVITSQDKYLARKKTLSVGNIVLFPVSFSKSEDGKDNDREVCFLVEKREIKVLKYLD